MGIFQLPINIEPFLFIVGNNHRKREEKKFEV